MTVVRVAGVCVALRSARRPRKSGRSRRPGVVREPDVAAVAERDRHIRERRRALAHLRLRLRPAGVALPSRARWQQRPPSVASLLTSKPTADSDIKIEVWLPASGWNGKFQAVGNGGWAGTISYPAAGGGRGRARLCHREHRHRPHDARRLVRGRASGEARRLRASVAARDGRARQSRRQRVLRQSAAASVWNGCSTGGNQGLTLASMYPPTSTRSSRARRRTMRIAGARRARWRCTDLSTARPAATFRREKYPAIHAAVMKACDAKGRRERRRHREPSSVPLRSEGAPVQGRGRPVVPDHRAGRNRARPLLGRQASKNGARCFYSPLLQPGSELLWGTLAGPQPFSNASETYKYLVAKDPAWDPSRFDPAVDVERMDNEAAVLNTAGHNLKPFFARGGKLLMYHGWSDQQNPASTSVNYFTRS